MKFLSLIFVVAIMNFADGVNVCRHPPEYRLPAEWENHQRTFMVWPTGGLNWIKGHLEDVRRDVALIANSIVPFEPVVMFASPNDMLAARNHLHQKIELIAMHVDDLWARDTFPTFVFKTQFGKERISGVDMNYNGYGNKKKYKKDAKLAGNVLRLIGLEHLKAEIVGEGGALETDGRGTLLATKSSIANENRNNKTIDEIEIELKKVLGIKKIIWLDGVKGEDITDEHVDVLVRFVRPGVVVVTRPFPGDPPDVFSACSDQALSVMKRSTDADGNQFQIIEIVEPNRAKVPYKGDWKTFCNSYANFYIGNGFVIISQFGDREADANAVNILRQLFPGRVIIPVLVNFVAYGGGGIHCTVHEQPALTQHFDWLRKWFT